jgi:hypothetical protein
VVKYFVDFILFLDKQEWVECLTKIRCKIKMRKIFICVFLNVSGPFLANWGWRGASSRGLSLET